MSIAINDTAYPGVPRLSEANFSIVDMLDQELEQREYFCCEGHAFSLDFIPGINIPSYWECPVVTCGAIAVDHPL